MKELDFKERVINNYKNYLSNNMTDDESYNDVLCYSASALDGLLCHGFDFAAMQDVLSFYLSNSKDCVDTKLEKARCVRCFVDAAQTIMRDNIQLGILNETLFEMSDKGNPYEAIRHDSVKMPETQTM